MALTVEQARKAEAAARATLSDLERDRDAEIRAARDAIRARWEAAIDEATEALNAARRALVAAEDATPGHKWEGRRVFKLETTGPSYNRSTRRLDGIVETWRSNSVAPANQTYGFPEIGEAIVRFCKKDGTAGLKFEKLDRSWGAKWQLAEDAADA